MLSGLLGVGDDGGDRPQDNHGDGTASNVTKIAGRGNDRSAAVRASFSGSNHSEAAMPVWERSPLGGIQYGDSLRGIRGWMVPVADTVVERVTPEEAAWYAQRAQYFTENWGQTDPIMIGIKRFRLDGTKERVVFDGRVAPFGSKRYSWLTDSIGPPLYLRPAKSPDDVIRLEASIAEGTMFPSVQSHQLYAAIQRDAQSLSSLDPNEWWTTLKMVQGTPGYIGSWPTAGVLDSLPMLGGRPDSEGFTHSIGRKIWRMQHNGFSVVSMDRQRLTDLKPHLEMVQAENPAQLRLEIGDLAESQLAGWANTLWRQRSWQSSVANARLLHLLMQHFRMPPGEAKQRAQSLLNAKLICSLDGKYQLRGPDGLPVAEFQGGFLDSENQAQSGGVAGAGQGEWSPLSYHWVSDMWPSDNQMAASAWAEEESPLLKWFRGAMLEVLQQEKRFLVHGYLDIDRAVEETAKLPGFDLFKGFSLN